MITKPKIKLKIIHPSPENVEQPYNTCVKHPIPKHNPVQKSTPILREEIYHVIKCPLKSVLKNYHILQPVIEQNVVEMNQIMILGYQFIKLYTIDKFDKNQNLPIINKQWILDVLKTICNKTTRVGPKPKGERKEQLEDLKQFNDSVFSTLTKIESPSYTNKTHIFDTHAEQMLTCIETNLATHFIKYVSKYVNCLFRKAKAEIIHHIKDAKQRKEEYKLLAREIHGIKIDLINVSIEHSKPEYHQWLQINFPLLFPSEIIGNIAYDVKCQPLHYLKHAIYINKQLEILQERPYQVFPQRNTMIPRHMTLDTTNMIDIISNDCKIFTFNKNKMYDHIQAYQKHVWGQILKVEKKNIFQQKNYTFHYQIKTDGWACSLLFILNKYKNKKRTTKIPKQIRNEDTNEFQKLTNLSEEDYQKYQSVKYKKIGLDPGKRKIVTSSDDAGKIFQYSACQRRRETYTKRSSQILEKEKTRMGINQIESVLKGSQKLKKQYKKKRRYRYRQTKKHLPPPINNTSNTKTDDGMSHNVSSMKKSLNPIIYTQFIDQKNRVNILVKSFYERELFRKLGYRRYIKTKQSEQNLMNTILHTYLTDQEIDDGKKIVIFHGDYSRTDQMKGCVPSPNIGLKRKMLNFFDIVDVDEYLTSQKYWKTHEQLTNLHVRRGHHMRSIHGILIPTENTKRCIHVDRDVNASHNILDIANHYLVNRERLEVFRRP